MFIYLFCLSPRFQLLLLFDADLPHFSQELMGMNEDSGAQQESEDVSPLWEQRGKKASSITLAKSSVFPGD